MTVWVAFPSAAPAEQAKRCILAWRERGYLVAIQVDDDARLEGSEAHVTMSTDYEGYAEAINALVAEVLHAAPHPRQCRWIVAAADDVYPGDHDPLRVARECEEHFGGTLGVMQPTGDPWRDHCVEKYAGSPWLGREWCERAYGGRGPLWDGYHHYYVDNELQRVAQRLSLFWQRRDLVHRHESWKRGPKGAPVNEYGFWRDARRPDHLQRARVGWQADHDLFEEREAAGFPGSDLA